MKYLTLESKEFNRVLQNLRLEKQDISLTTQKKVLEIVNSKTKITPELIKELIKEEEIE